MGHSDKIIPTLDCLTREIRSCTLCVSDLPLGANPVLQVSSNSKILIAGQAPGTRVHKSSIPFDDASCERLRNWMGVDKSVFYDAERIAIVPMGFCYPGTGSSGDLPPRPECAAAWREQLLATLASVELTLVIGQYAQAYHLPGPRRTVTEHVQSWQDHWPQLVPLPHPSPRNNRWLQRNPWFESELLPTLKNRVLAIM